MGKTNGSQQVSTLQSLSQQTASWLVGISPRNLRDNHEVPRNPNGSYNAKDLLSWAACRDETIRLGDAWRERLLVAAEAISPEPTAAFVHLVADLKAEFGEKAYAILGKAFADCWQAAYRRYPDDVEDPSRREYDRGYADWLHRAEDHAARARLRIATRCDSCNRLRVGPKWVNATTPGGFIVSKGLCPQCEAD